MRTGLGLRTAALAVGLLAGSAGAAAQTVERVGSSDVAVDRRLARLLAADALIVTSDLRIDASDTIHGSVLVLDATVIHEGTIRGDLVLVDAGGFIRHESAVEGDLVNVAGGLYRSEMARVGGTILDLPDAGYRVLREGDRILIEATAGPGRLRLDGLDGFRPPVYDRVNGLTATWGASYRLPRLRGVTPVVRGHVGWRTQRGDPTYGASLDARSGAVTFSVGYGWASATHDDWAWSELRNSVNYLWDGEDFRNHYEVERARVGLTRAFGDEAKRLSAELRLVARIEDARSLSGDEPWHLFGDSARSNPPVDDGRISSAVGGFDVAWHGWETDLMIGAEYESGRDWQGGEYRFDRLAARAEFAMRGLRDHTLQIRAFGQLPLGQDTLPRQRWTFVGGASTLQTLSLGRHRGDHVLFVESRYRIPSPEAVALPLLGAPELQLVHAAGKAWLADDDGALTQEIGARVQFFGLYGQYMLQPADTSQAALVVGITWPFDPAFPWEY